HHWGGVPFVFPALADSPTYQAALSLIWGVAGCGAMLLGTRRRERVVWFAGAALMAVVVVKLFFVDLANAGNGGRLVSFLGVGALLYGIGYFAPVPPRDRAERPDDTHDDTESAAPHASSS